ncbi:hypothetical protein PIGHUM_04324 [Pigmentiphaga humi]|uniref:Uncharacterized protein n=1 Tax=Pigmentiphaga humi TaxID=2478468 RepID=A0A3P4B9M7_9BURK|nr:hypothetical protein [Pigmentiphaga humi]VCU72226.1 hypothetical protein PIGHUM_04324 [Pigmentiphaga humi]
MSKKQDASPLDGTLRKRRYEARKRKTHQRLELRVLHSDIDRIAKIGVKPSELIPTLLRCYDDWKRLAGSRHAGPKNTYLPDCHHRAWRRLGHDILDFVGCERSVDIAFQHHLRDRVEDALLEMLRDMLDDQPVQSLSLDLVGAMLVEADPQTESDEDGEGG